VGLAVRRCHPTATATAHGLGPCPYRLRRRPRDSRRAPLNERQHAVHDRRSTLKGYGTAWGVVSARTEVNGRRPSGSVGRQGRRSGRIRSPAAGGLRWPFVHLGTRGRVSRRLRQPASWITVSIRPRPHPTPRTSPASPPGSSSLPVLRSSKPAHRWANCYRVTPSQIADNPHCSYRPHK